MRRMRRAASATDGRRRAWPATNQDANRRESFMALGLVRRRRLASHQRTSVTKVRSCHDAFASLPMTRIKPLDPAVIGRDRVAGGAGLREARSGLLESGRENRIVGLLQARARRRSCRRPTASMEVLMAVKQRSSREPEIVAGNGLIDRRALLGRGIVYAGAASAAVGTGLTGAAAEP